MMRMALRDILDMIFSVIKTAEPVDILDILVLSYVVYLGMKLVRETRAGQLLKGRVPADSGLHHLCLDQYEGDFLSAF